MKVINSGFFISLRSRGMLDINLRKTFPRTFDTLVFTAAALVISVLCYLADPGPLLPPFPKDFTSVDCRAVSFHSFAPRYGAIDVYCNVTETIEFPVNICRISCLSGPGRMATTFHTNNTT